MNNRKTTKGRLITYQHVYQQVPVTEQEPLPLKLNWIMEFLIWIHLAKAADFQKYKTVVTRYNNVRVKTIKHRLSSQHQIATDKTLEERAKELSKVAKKSKKLNPVSKDKQIRNERKRNEKLARRGSVVYDSANMPPLRGSIEMRQNVMKSS